MAHPEGPSSDKYRQYFERSGDAFLIIEGSSFVDCNQATVEMLRYRTREEFLQTHPSELSPEYQPDGRRSQEKADEMMAIAFERGSHRFEWDHRRADGEVFPVEVLLTAVPQPDGVSLHVVWRDLTEQYRLESDLRQAQKMEALGRLCGGIAHDFNNILVAIIGHSEMLVSDLSDRPELQAGAREVLTAGRRAADLVHQLLAFSRKQVLRPQAIDLGQSLRGMSEMLTRLLGEHIQVELEIAPDPVWVRADPGQITQVILNFATNARDALTAGGRLRIMVGVSEVGPGTPGLRGELVDGTYATLVAEDGGEGITPRDLPRIFDPFFTTKTVGRGTGLGLATAYGIVRQSGGSIAVESARGEGSRFTVYLPLTPPPPPESDGRDEVEAVAGRIDGRTVLLVEDEPATGRLVRLMLERAGLTVLVADNGEAALRLMEDPTLKPDLVLTDVVMPGMNGVELARRLREKHPDLRVLFASGYTADFLSQQGAVPADVDLIQKPFSARDLIERIREMMGRV